MGSGKKHTRKEKKIILINLVLYGSLLNPNELKRLDLDFRSTDFVKVYGFKRVLNQLPSWRESKSIEKAVMNIEESKEGWFNALLLRGVSKRDLADLDKREKGYSKISLKENSIINYEGSSIPNCIVYKGKANMQSDKILPNQTYLKICKEGARSRFEEFYEDFLNSTYKNDLKGGFELI